MGMKSIMNTPLRLLMCVLISASTSSISHATSSENIAHGGGLFVPDLDYYNPLQHGQVRRDRLSSHAMTNDQLLQAAQYIRSDNMSAQQRALNHQWLEQEHYNQELRLGNKVVSKIFKMGFKTYWNGVRNKHYSSSTVIPDGDGKGKLTQDVDYKLRLSDDKVRLSLQYDF